MNRPGAQAVLDKGIAKANGWLVARRLTQLGILALFMLGPWAGVWIVKGNLNSSITLDVLPLTDPFVFVQSLAARHWPETDAIVGAAIVAGFYWLVGGRSYCGWVCPVNLVTDGAHWMRRKLRLGPGRAPQTALRYWLMGGVIATAAVTGSIAWESINPVSILHRGLIFGFGLGWAIVLAVFLYDLLVAERGWCGHICPVGAFYATLGRAAILRVSAARRGQCNDCADCYAVCPEPRIIKPALKGSGPAAAPVILAGTCSNCGRCIDVCSKDVFRFTTRFDNRSDI
jgi:ferredoxin-type protein NapH